MISHSGKQGAAIVRRCVLPHTGSPGFKIKILRTKACLLIRKHQIHPQFCNKISTGEGRMNILVKARFAGNKLIFSANQEQMHSPPLCTDMERFALRQWPEFDYSLISLLPVICSTVRFVFSRPATR